MSGGQAQREAAVSCSRRLGVICPTNEDVVLIRLQPQMTKPPQEHFLLHIDFKCLTRSDLAFVVGVTKISKIIIEGGENVQMCIVLLYSRHLLCLRRHDDKFLLSFSTC